MAISVCMITGAFYPEVSGGGLQCKTLIDALGENIKPYVITTSSFKGLKSEVLPGGIRVFRVYLNPKSFISKIRALFAFFSIFLKLSPQVDIVQLHGFSQKNIIVILLSKLFAKKIVHKFTSAGQDDPLSISAQRLGAIKIFFLSVADVFINVSPALVDRFKKSSLSGKNMFFIPNGVDTQRFSPAGAGEKMRFKKELGLKADKKTILFVGFFSCDKAPDVLLNAWVNMRQDLRKATQLLFVGSTSSAYFEISQELAVGMKKLINDLNLNNDVVFIEKALDIEKYYKASDIFVLPSKREGLPNTLLEAMSSGLVCIVSRIPGVTDYLIEDSVNGFLFNQGDSAGLAERLNTVLTQEAVALSVGVNARSRVLNNFSMDKISAEYLKIYKNGIR